MENDREEIVDIRSCIAYLMIKWKILLLALLIGALAGGALGFMKQRAVPAPSAQAATYEEKLKSLRDALQETDALYVEQVYDQYRNYGKQLGYWRQYLEDSALQNMKPDDYVRRDLQFIVESDNSDVISSFSVSLLGTADYERIAEALGDNITATNAVELISVSNVAQADSGTSQPAVQIGDMVAQDPTVSVTPSSYRCRRRAATLSRTRGTCSVRRKRPILTGCARNRAKHRKNRDNPPSVKSTRKNISRQAHSVSSCWLLPYCSLCISTPTGSGRKSSSSAATISRSF